jgi:hypothetical protein
MLANVKKHINKILVLALNFLLMAIAILVIKEKDQARLSEKKQNDLLNDNASLSDENAALKNEIQSFRGTLEGNEPIPAEEENKVETPKAEAQAPEIPASTTAPPPVITKKSTPTDTAKKNPSSSNTSNSTKNSSSNSSASSPTPSPPPATTAPPSNSQTKTS